MAKGDGRDPGVGIDVRDNPAESRFEACLQGLRVGMLMYREQPGRLSLVHTETDASMTGQGIATRLVQYALDACRDRGVAVYPYCPFVRGFIEGHPDYVDLVPTEVRGRFGLP